MTLLALVAIIFFGFATYNLTCAFVDIPTKKTSRMMMLARKQQGVKTEKLLDVYITKIAGLIAPYLKLDKLKRNKLQRALDIAGLELTPEIYTARAWVTAGAVGLCSILMVFLVPLMVPVLIGLAVALWFSTYYSVFDFVKKRRKLIESEIPRFALTIGQNAIFVSCGCDACMYGRENAEILSIHIGLYPDGVPLEELLPAQDDLMQEFEMKQLLQNKLIWAILKNRRHFHPGYILLPQ